MPTSGYAVVTVALVAAVAQPVCAQDAQNFTPQTIVQFAQGGDRERAAFSQIPDLAPLVKGDFGIGVADFNDDGANEIVLLSLSCDDAGCPLVVLQNQGGQTAEIFAQKIGGRVAITREKINGYHAVAAADQAGAIMTDSATGRQLVYSVGAKAPAVAAGSASAASAPAAPRPQRNASAAAPAGNGPKFLVPANSGTPDATAAIIKMTPAISAGGFHLGMPRDAAIAELQAEGLFDHDGAQPQIGFAFNELPGHSFVGGSSGLKTGPAPRQSEEVTLDYSTEPSTPVVVAIRRSVAYADADRPNVENTLAALRQKYGPESGTREGAGNDLYWLFDYQGHPLSGEQLAAQQKLGCWFDFIPELGDPPTAVAKGYAETLGGTTPYPNKQPELGCLETIGINVVLGIVTANGDAVTIDGAADWSAHPSDLVRQMIVTVKDVPLEYSASAATRAIVLAGGQKQTQEKLDSGRQNKPSL